MSTKADSFVFPNPASEFVYMRTYSRWIDELGRRETWPETVDRYVAFIKKHRGEKIPEKVLRKIRENILNMKVMPSMRALWAAGAAAENDNTCLYNCSFETIDSIEAFSESLYVLMCGSGFGFRVSKIDAEKLPVVPKITSESSGTFVISDDKAGWANSVERLVSSLYAGKDLEMDYSKIRKKGERLKTMGGRASGPEPLLTLHNFIREVFNNAQGRKLKTIELHDIENQIAEIVVVGGVRRSSEISLSDLDDEEMRLAKTGAFPVRRWMANNSAIYHSKPSAVDFLKEWSALAASGTGERGIFNVGSAKKRAPKRRNAELLEGTNPCQPGFATVLTPEGIRTFDDISIGSVIWSGNEWTKVVNKWSTGTKPVFEYTTTMGKFVGTENHRIVQNGEKTEVGNAESIDVCVGPDEIVLHSIYDMMDGLVLGDGSVHKASNNKVYLLIGDNDQDYFNSEIANLIIDKTSIATSGKAYIVETTIQPHELPKTYERKVPDRFFYGDKNKKASFLRGLYTANGSVISGRITLKQSSKELIDQVQVMLSSLGISSYVTVNKSHNVKFNNGDYVCRESYDLNILSSRDIFAKKIGFIQKYKQEKIKPASNGRKTRSSDIKDKKYLGEFEVYDITVEADSHTYWTGGCLASNCGEILLRSKQFCNLSEVVVRAEDDLDDLLKKVETATWIGVIQSTFTYFPYLSKEWKENCDEERLLGVSLTGQLDNPSLMTAETFKALQKKAVKVAKHASSIMGINMPAAITCVKPSGTVSQLVDSASGLHTRYSKYYIRRYRVSASDPISRMLRDQGIVLSPENGQSKQDWDNAASGATGFCPIYKAGESWSEDKVNTWVVSFPIKAPENCVTRNEMTAIEQLEHYKKVQANWCEHNASSTVYVKDHEWFEVGNWVYQNWDYITGVSFLPHDGGSYKQPPYEEIDEKTYLELEKKMPKIDYLQLSKYELEDNTEGAKSLACAGGVCELN